MTVPCATLCGQTLIVYFESDMLQSLNFFTQILMVGVIAQEEQDFYSAGTS